MQRAAGSRRTKWSKVWMSSYLLTQSLAGFIACVSIECASEGHVGGGKGEARSSGRDALESLSETFRCLEKESESEG
jgi:hypothetical protein